MEDPLEPDLHYGLLTDVLLGPTVYAELLAIGTKIRDAWVVSVDPADADEEDSGRLVASADVQMVKGGTAHPGDRWECEFTAGGVTAPYARYVEGRGHALEEVLRAMGYDTTGMVF